MEYFLRISPWGACEQKGSMRKYIHSTLSTLLRIQICTGKRPFQKAGGFSLYSIQSALSPSHKSKDPEKAPASRLPPAHSSEYDRIQYHDNWRNNENNQDKGNRLLDPTG